MTIPTPQVPRLCVSCRHLYGRMHGGVTLVCAMHPTGPDGDACGDYERIGPNAKPTAKTLPATPPPTTSPELLEPRPRRPQLPDALRVLHDLVAFLVSP
jgi:hypothetical protein